ncbi:MAG: methyltransferase [Flavobacteriales bacterium]|nr:methyltransferase [Flavobacteriales bacterium]
MLEQFRENYAEGAKVDHPIILHDLFGYLSCHLSEFSAQTVITFASQRNSVSKNRAQNQIEKGNLIDVLKDWPTTGYALMKVPKSIDLFELYLSKLANSLTENGQVLCGFMTRNFTPSWLKVAERYFRDISQTKARKKARLLVLKDPIPQEKTLLKRFFDDEEREWQQYLGVFSSGRIDPASRFMMEEVEVPKGEIAALDLGCGNGVLGRFILDQNPAAKLILVDDNELAVASARLNISGNHSFYCHSNLMEIESNSVDMVICNPPFHLEYEVNTDVAYRMFKDAARVLKADGVFWVVANNNLPYKPKLLQSFHNCEIVAKNRKFFVYRCWGVG